MELLLIEQYRKKCVLQSMDSSGAQWLSLLSLLLIITGVQSSFCILFNSFIQHLQNPLFFTDRSQWYLPSMTFQFNSLATVIQRQTIGQGYYTVFFGV